MKPGDVLRRRSLDLDQGHGEMVKRRNLVLDRRRGEMLRRRNLVLVGCSQEVRRRNLGPSIKGSNPFIPVFPFSRLKNLIPQEKKVDSNCFDIFSVFLFFLL